MRKTRKILGLESLEARQLLAADLISSAFADDVPSDFYIADGREIDLLPNPGEFVVGADFGSEISLSSLLSLETAEASAITNSHEMTDRLFELRIDTQTTLAELNTDLQNRLALAGYADAQDELWIAPVYTNGESGLTQWMTEEVIVKLEEGIDPQSFFADSMFAEFRGLGGTHDQFIAIIEDPGEHSLLDATNTIIPAMERSRLDDGQFRGTGHASGSTQRSANSYRAMAP